MIIFHLDGQHNTVVYKEIEVFIEMQILWLNLNSDGGCYVADIKKSHTFNICLKDLWNIRRIGTVLFDCSSYVKKTITDICIFWCRVWRISVGKTHILRSKEFKQF